MTESGWRGAVFGASWFVSAMVVAATIGGGVSAWRVVVALATAGVAAGAYLVGERRRTPASGRDMGDDRREE
jgi:hypothetical protein